MGIDVFAALVAGLAFGLFGVYFARQARSRPADARIVGLADRPVQQGRRLAWDEIRRSGPSRLPLLRGLSGDNPWATAARAQLEQAGLRLHVAEYLLGRLLLGLVTFLLIWVLGRSTVTFVLGIGCGFVAYMLPALWLSVLRRRRITKIGKQMPEAVSLIANSLRAGFAFQHGVDLVAQQMEPPIAAEFSRLVVDMNIGSTLEEALGGLLRRADCEDVHLVVTAVLIQRTSGGNLSEVLETLGETMRERERLSGEVRTMTAQQRFSGTVLSLWPVALLALFALFNWSQTSALFTTKIGLVLLAIAGGLQLIGYYVMSRILDIDI